MCPINNNQIFCKVKLQNTISDSLSITIEKLSYNGPIEFRERCLHGGITVYPITADKADVEALTSC